MLHSALSAAYSARRHLASALPSPYGLTVTDMTSRYLGLGAVGAGQESVVEESGMLVGQLAQAADKLTAEAQEASASTLDAGSAAGAVLTALVASRAAVGAVMRHWH